MGGPSPSGAARDDRIYAMKFSVNWLREFVELPPSVEALADLLTLAGIEIEGIEKRGANFDNVVVALITASSQHPNADRLSVCQVDDGSGQPRQIVCGAKNYKVGDKVPLALPGAVLVNDLRIKPSKLRGVESQGMLCSPSELGLSQESDGLLILSPDAKIGQPIASLFPADTILDVEITPNRGDLLSHFGLAREISALVGQPVRRPNQATAGGAPALQQSGIEISSPHDCPFYSARRIENIAVGPSPDWLRAKLEAVGLRSINNVVDISNFVMLELGQPTHAFDADKLKGEIVVRPAREGENFLALDGKTYNLNSQDLVIADQERVIGLAGVMGGEETGVTAATKNVLLESALFRPGSVRQTARRLNLPSDASYRFERGVDPAMIPPASQRVTELIQELAAGSPSLQVATAGELPPPPNDVLLRYGRCERLIGLAIPKERVDQILEGFGLTKARTGEDEGSWRIPTYRSDLKREADLIEEVVRVFGIERVPVNDRSRFTPESQADRIYDFESDLRQRLVARGLSEARTSALIPRTASLFGASALELRNPLSEDHVALRPTLLAGLLEVLGRNVRAGAASIRLFELGRVFSAENAAETKNLAFVFSGSAGSGPHWRSESRRLDLFDLKGVIDTIGIPELSLRRSARPNLAISADILSGSNVIGFIGQPGAAQSEALGVSSAVLVAEIEIRFGAMENNRGVTFREIEKFPSVTRDIAMIVPEKITHREIMTTIETAREPLLATIELFDLFSGKEAASLGAGKKSLAYTLTYRDKTRTLTNDEVTVVHAKIRERLQRELGVELRE
ncbi:MAG: phenylalanine--tRNA ligase subunit beta [Verrucomicrobia bacterium]|nr:MAG: phenylalanine--tRNA ligase subunit beta [Verrucomicrobiota bacterium]